MGKKFLFVIDMQNDFIDGSLGSDEAKKIVPNVVKLIQNLLQLILIYLKKKIQQYIFIHWGYQKKDLMQKKNW